MIERLQQQLAEQQQKQKDAEKDKTDLSTAVLIEGGSGWTGGGLSGGHRERECCNYCQLGDVNTELRGAQGQEVGGRQQELISPCE